MSPIHASLGEYVAESSFPCVMAKAVFSKGYVSHHEVTGISPQESAAFVLKEMSDFVHHFRTHKQLSSFIVSFTHPSFNNFQCFEAFFWNLLESIDALDKTKHKPDPRVSNDPESPHFSYSMCEEAFFMLILHPESPRIARRFSSPTVVFNAHQQFEDLRTKGLFHKVRDLIRKRDSSLQGFINPMVNDYGESSEVFQYTGREYPAATKCPFQRAAGMLKGLLQNRQNLNSESL